MNLLDIHHENVRMKMFMYSLDGDAHEWYFSLPPSSISSLKNFHRVFHEHCKRYFSYEFLFENCCEEYELHDENEDINRKEIVPHNLQQLSNDLHDDVSSHKLELELENEKIMVLECAENKETFSTIVFKEESTLIVISKLLIAIMLKTHLKLYQMFLVLLVMIS